MSVESDFYSLLSGAGAVTALVATRIYPDALPEECDYPAVVFARARTDEVRSVSGQVFGADVDLLVGCWAVTRAAADAVAVAIEGLLTGTWVRVAREAVFDPQSGLYATNLTVTTFATN